MKSKFELALSTSYVPDWGVVEAIRELFQNALDNEIVNPENRMEWKYTTENETLRISNRTSVLEAGSLLLGSGTKHNDNRTIGKHGEGYKIAFMVLLRSDKKIKVYNYGKRETWEVKLVKSKRYNGELLTTIIVDKEAFWSKVPDNHLTIEITGITTDEYVHIVNKNLHLRKDNLETFEVKNRGRIILNSEEAGNIYVKGLFVNHIDGFKYGYDFEPSIVNLDRDRKLIDTFNVSWEASALWTYASETNEKINRLGAKLVRDGALDVSYVHIIGASQCKIHTAVAENFIEEYGDDAIPVVDNTEYAYISDCTNNKPVITNEHIANIVKSSGLMSKIEVKESVSIKEQLKIFANKISNKLDSSENAELLSLIDKIAN